MKMIYRCESKLCEKLITVKDVQKNKSHLNIHKEKLNL